MQILQSVKKSKPTALEYFSFIDDFSLNVISYYIFIQVKHVAGSGVQHLKASSSSRNNILFIKEQGFY